MTSDGTRCLPPRQRGLQRRRSLWRLFLRRGASWWSLAVSIFRIDTTLLFLGRREDARIIDLAPSSRRTVKHLAHQDRR